MKVDEKSSANKSCDTHEENIEDRKEQESRKMTKDRCKMCELLGERSITADHGLSDPRHLASFHQLNHRLHSAPSGGLVDIGLAATTINYATNPNYLEHGLLSGLYLPQLKDMMLPAYLLRGKLQARFQIKR